MKHRLEEEEDCGWFMVIHVDLKKNKGILWIRNADFKLNMVELYVKHDSIKRIKHIISYNIINIISDDGGE